MEGLGLQGTGIRPLGVRVMVRGVTGDQMVQLGRRLGFRDGVWLVPGIGHSACQGALYTANFIHSSSEGVKVIFKQYTLNIGRSFVHWQ